MHRTLCAALLATMTAASALAQGAGPSQGGATVSNVPSDVVKELAPTGTLRVAINQGNIVLAQGTPDNADRRHASTCRASLPSASACRSRSRPSTPPASRSRSMKAGKTDIVFLAIEPVRAAEVAFTAPYVLIEGVYVVPKDSTLNSPADVDQRGRPHLASTRRRPTTCSSPAPSRTPPSCARSRASTPSSRTSSTWWPA